jgi:hypothetical protein
VDFHPNSSDSQLLGDWASAGSMKEEKRSLEPSDIFLGATVTILAHKFDILDCDQFTSKYMEANPNLWKYSNLTMITDKILDKKDVLKKIILTFPSLQSKIITVEDLESIFAKSGLKLVKQEVYTVFRAVDVLRLGSVKLTKMLKYIMDLN